MANKYKWSKVKVINPYTFVPINPNKINGKNTKNELPSAKEFYQGKLYTGVLHCRLQVITPLAIPDTSEVSVDKGHKTYPFYRQPVERSEENNNNFIIPGSSLRGVIRSVYETVTESCFSTVNPQKNLSKRVDPRQAYKPGILIKKNGVFHLYSAERYLIPVKGYNSKIKNSKVVVKQTFPRIEANGNMRAIGKKAIEENEEINKEDILKTGERVHFNSSKEPYTKQGGKVLVWNGIVQEFSENGKKCGIVYLGENFMGKHGDSVFVKSKEETGITSKRLEDTSKILEEAFNKLKDTLDEYRNKAINKNIGGDEKDTWYPGFENLKPENGIPLWYDLSDGVHFSYASIGRTMYNTTLNEHLKELDRCKSRDHLCEACLLFGMVGTDESKNKSMGSRIRVTDAHPTQPIDSKELEFVPLKELGSPRYSYLPFYAKYADKNKKGVPVSYDEEGVEISGRKYYWNNERAREVSVYKMDNEDNKTKRNATMELMPPGKEFSFNIYYDEIKEEQLKKLLWAITIGQNKLPDELVGEKEDLLCHKLGSGKPLGLGSVKIVVEDNQNRIFDQSGYHIITKNIEKDIKAAKLPDSSVKYVKRVLSMNLQQNDPNVLIDYPNIVDWQDKKIDEQEQENNNFLARHQWYSNNKKYAKQNLLFDDENDMVQVLNQYRYTPYPAVVCNQLPSDDNRYYEYVIKMQMDGDNRFSNKKCILQVDRKEKGGKPLINDQKIYVSVKNEFSDKVIFIKEDVFKENKKKKTTQNYGKKRR